MPIGVQQVNLALRSSIANFKSRTTPSPRPNGKDRYEEGQSWQEVNLMVLRHSLM